MGVRARNGEHKCCTWTRHMPHPRPGTRGRYLGRVRMCWLVTYPRILRPWPWPLFTGYETPTPFFFLSFFTCVRELGMVSTSVARGPGTCPTLAREQGAGISALCACVVFVTYPLILGSCFYPQFLATKPPPLLSHFNMSARARNGEHKCCAWPGHTPHPRP